MIRCDLTCFQWGIIVRVYLVHFNIIKQYFKQNIIFYYDLECVVQWKAIMDRTSNYCSIFLYNIKSNTGCIKDSTLQ